MFFYVTEARVSPLYLLCPGYTGVKLAHRLQKKKKKVRFVSGKNGKDRCESQDQLPRGKVVTFFIGDDDLDMKYPLSDLIC